MLEADHDQHVKAYQRIKSWDNAHSSYRDLYALKVKAMEKYKEIGRALAYERALASIGVSREEVAHVIRADQIGATHNYKRTVPSKQCRTSYCDRQIKHFPAHAEKCPSCQEPLTPSNKTLTQSDLRGKYAAYWVGVETQDGRTIMFDSPVPQDPLQDELNASVAQE